MTRRTTYTVARGRLPVVGHALPLMRNPLRFLRSLQGQADLVEVDLGPVRTLFVTDPELIHAMLTDRQDNFDKGRFYDKVRPLAGNGVVLAQGAEHRRQLAMIKPAFHRRQLRDYTDVMRAVVLEKAAEWRPGQEIAIDKEMHIITLRILARTMFGAGVTQEQAAELAGLLPVVLKSIMWRTVDPGDLLASLPLPINRRFAEANARLREMIHRVMLTYRSRNIEGGDMLSMLLAARDEETGASLSSEEICDQIVAVTMAGSETAATAMTWMFYELARAPGVRRQVVDEIGEVLGDKEVTFENFEHLPYCRLVLQEVLRLRQPIMVISRRSTTSVRIGGGYLRPGTELFYSPYAVFRDPRYFPDPLRFDPDRWLSAPAATLPRGIYTPFGGGPRHCIGEQFAWAMMTVVLAEVCRRWELHASPGLKVREMPWATINPNAMPMIAWPVAKCSRPRAELP
jgi:cytochrome P450